MKTLDELFKDVSDKNKDTTTSEPVDIDDDDILFTKDKVGGDEIQSSVTGITKDKFDVTAPEVIPQKQDKTLESDLMAAYAVCEEEMKAIAEKAAKSKE